MAQWDRDTKWRQGAFLSAECISALGLSGVSAAEGVVAVVITHDCDLAQSAEIEPNVEILLGHEVPGGAEGNYTYGKNVRRIHAQCTGGTVGCSVELEWAGRQIIPKNSVNGLASLAAFQPCPKNVMTPAERNVLQHWLAARYKRAAFPDEFDRRLKDQTKLAERLGKICKDSGQHVIAVLFDVDQGIEQTRNGADDPYELTVTLVYSVDADPEAAQEAADTTAKKFREAFEARCLVDVGDTKEWQWIELQDVECVSAAAFTYQQSQQSNKWHVDHISLRTQPTGEIM